MAQDDVIRAIGQRVRSVRERLRMTQETVAERLGIPRSAVSDLETGKREISATELFGLADLFSEPVDELLGIGEPSPDAELVMLRAQEVTSESRLALKRFLQGCREYLELEQLTGERREADLRSPRTILTTFEQARRLADDERRRLELGATPAHLLIPVLEERVGVKVLFMTLDESLSGASIRSRTFGPAMLVNRSHVPGRRVFTAAHEYFHLLTEGRVAGSKGPEALHVCSPPDGGRKDRADQLADQFAARLLLPPDQFVEFLRGLENEQHQVNPFDLNRVGKYFGVSTQAVFVQMAVLGLVSWERYKKIYNDKAFQDRLMAERSGESGSEPQRFRNLAVKAHLMGQISRARLAELLEVNIAEVGTIVDEVGGAGGSSDGLRLSLSR